MKINESKFNTTYEMYIFETNKYNIPWKNEKYYTAITLDGDKKLASVSIKGTDEAVELLTKRTPMLVQIHSEGPKTYDEVDKWLDNIEDYELIQGDGVNKRITNI